MNKEISDVDLYSADVISLCTGGGGLDLGFELAIPRARSVCLVEREAFAIGQLVSAMQQGLMGQAPIWSDVTTFNGRPWRGLVDGVIGGIPCQPHSLAGKRGGEDDERDLWSDARRIIVQSGAWFVLIENVSGMLSAKPGLDSGALRVRRDLQRLGFDVEGGLFTASEVGASHERERVFILAVANASLGQFPVAGRGELGGSSGKRDRPEAYGSAAEFCGASLVDASGERRGKGQSESIIRGGGHSAAIAGGAMADANRQGRSQSGGAVGKIGRWAGDGSEPVYIFLIILITPQTQDMVLPDKAGRFPCLARPNATRMKSRPR